MVLCLLKLIHALPHVLYVECINTCQFSIPSSFWVHTFDWLVASKPCLRSAALALVLRKLGENRSRKAIPRTRAPSTSFLIPKEVKEEVCWRGLPGQKRLSGRKCPMCVRRRLFNNNEWTEHPGNASSQTCCKLLMFNWFVYFVKISFYMIGQAKHAPVVAKAVCQRLNCCLAPQCRDIGATARAARHTSTLITYIQSSRMQLVLVPLLYKHNLLCCSCCSIASRTLPSIAFFTSTTRPLRTWRTGWAIFANVGSRRRRNPSSSATPRPGLMWKQMRPHSATQTCKKWPRTPRSRSFGSNGAASCNEVLHIRWSWSGWLLKHLPGERLDQAQSARLSGSRLRPSTCGTASSFFTQMQPSRTNSKWAGFCTTMSDTAKSVSKSRASGCGNCPPMSAWPHTRIPRLVANLRLKVARKL